MSIGSLQEIKSKTLSSQSKPTDSLNDPAKSLRDTGLSIKIYCDDRGRIERAWEEFKRRMSAYIQEKIISDDVIKEIVTERGLDLEKIGKLEQNCDVQIKVDKHRGEIRIKGHITVIAKIQEEKVLNDIKDGALRKGKRER